MSIPIVQNIEGQGGNISYKLPDGAAMNIIVRNWKIRKTFFNADVTTTGSGGWEERKRVLARWEFTADWPYDANQQRIGLYDGAVLVNNVWVPQGLTYPVAAACVFQIGASGSPTNQSAAVTTIAMQYQGNALVSAQEVANPATDVVQFTISGQGTGALRGPIAGMIS